MAQSRRRGRGDRRGREGRRGGAKLMQLRQRIKDGKVIPIIGNAVRNDRIFDIDYDYDIGRTKDKAKDEELADLNIDEELAEKWAEEIEYPLPDKRQLTRVAIYNSLINKFDDEISKREYLSFLKGYLLDIAEGDEHIDPDTLEDLWDTYEDLSFSDISIRLKYPRFHNHEDPLNLLAKLNLPIYVTTSYYDFMERALIAVERKPRTQICFLHGEPRQIKPEHVFDKDFRPTPEKPLVYHLFGFEAYPESLILSEDDYLDFLVKISEDQDLLPKYLWENLVESSLILLGYRLQDWDFRVLFRGVINSKHQSLRKLSFAIQLDPAEQKQIEDIDGAQEYLEKYFDKSNFEVEWDRADRFIEHLYRITQGEAIDEPE